MVWPWIVQLGKWRAGWYLPRSVERLVPPARRATRRVLPQWQGLSVGDVVPDYGGPRESFETVLVEPPRSPGLPVPPGPDRAVLGDHA